VNVTADLPVLPGRFAPAQVDSPLLTYYDDATGERTELSVRTLSGWAARTAGLLHEGCGLPVGARAAVLLPPHWQTAAVLLGCWAAGISVSYRSWAVAGLPASSSASEPVDAAFVSARRLDSWLENLPETRHGFVLGLATTGTLAASRPLPEIPAGYRDYQTEVARYSDSLPAYAPIRWTDAASVDGTTYREWGNLAGGLADSLGLRGGDRILVEAGEHLEPVQWLLAPLAVGASVVLCANLDRTRLDARMAAEGITRVL
jgi:uncharacterized protein (TIGR03089 family)